MLKKLINFLFKIYHFLIAWLSAVFFKNPSLKIFVVGVTGTKGKSSTVELLRFLCEKAGIKAASFSSIRQIIDGKEVLNLTGNTMPGRGRLQRFLKEAKESGCVYAFIEVTSQGVLQSRDKFIEWDAGFFLNLHPEHIEAHGSFENYRKAKVRFFENVLKSKKPKKYFFINKEDKNFNYFYEAVNGKENTEIILWSKADFLNLVKNEIGLDLFSPQKRKEINAWLVPDFNLVNVSAVYAFAKKMNFPREAIKATLLNFKGVPGRFEFVNLKPLVIVDYAHTPDSLEELYKSIEFYYKNPSGKIIGVLGSAGGGRDKWKRKEMGKIVAKYCNKIVLTNEDPFDEEPEDIIKEIRKGVDEYLKENNKFLEVEEILDREKALENALLYAKDEDIVVATGKGSEKYIRIDSNKKIPWDEKKVILKILGELKK